MADGKKKKTDKVTKAKKSSTSTDAMSDVAKALFRSMQDVDLKDLEIFEQYSSALRKKLYHSEEEFLSRFQNGYKALLNELS